MQDSLLMSNHINSNGDAINGFQEDYGKQFYISKSNDVEKNSSKSNCDLAYFYICTDPDGFGSTKDLRRVEIAANSMLTSFGAFFVYACLVV